jgi:hypothetical protein
VGVIARERGPTLERSRAFHKRHFPSLTPPFLAHYGAPRPKSPRLAWPLR